MKIQSYISSFFVIAVLSLVGCSSAHDLGDGSEFASGGTCDDVLLNQYKAQVYPFFRSESTCMHCHIEGGVGLGLFASSDPRASFAAFSAAGLSQVSFMATNPQHKPPYTGAQNKGAVDTLSATWSKDQSQYMDCQSKSLNGGVNESFLTASKGAPQIYADTSAMQTLTWELDSATDVDEATGRSVPARISIDIRILYQSNLAVGYIFSNPTMQLKDTTKAVVVEGLFFQINHQAISSQTTFTNLSRVITGPDQLPLMTAQANTLISPISTQDVFQLYVRRLALTSGVDDSPPPLTPILHVADSQTGSSALIKNQTANIAVLRDSGIIRWCLSESSTPPASTQAPCVNSVTGGTSVNGWQLARPMNYKFSAGDGTKTLYLWVADQNLKINEVPGVVTLTVDTSAPAAPTINSVTVTDSQVAAMSVSHPNEPDVTGWCVIEQNSIQAAPNTPNLDNDCWNWTENSVKPVTVGFKEGGARNIWVYVRDKAGNISAASNKMSSSNPFGAITFQQLTSTAGGPRAIFNNRCLTCHGTASNPGFSKLQLFNYNSATDVATSGVLVSRINNVISPMPNVSGGLMPQRERDLIRLWVMPEEGDMPLP